MINDRERNWIVGSIFVFAAVMGIVHISLGRITGDEGWYLHSARLVVNGKLPYRDFFFTQAPILPYVYGAILKVVGESYYTGRMISFVFLMAGMGLMLKVCRKLSGPVGESVAAALVGLNLFVIMQGCSVMTPALTMFLILASVFFMTSSCSPCMRTMLSVLFLSVAAMVRLSVLPAIILLIIYLYYAEGRKKTILITGIGTAVISLGALLVPLACAGGARFLFGTLQFHTSSHLPSFGLFLKYKSRFAGGCIAEFMPAILLGSIMTASIIIRFRRRPWREFIAYVKRNHIWAYLGAMALLITLGHFIVTVPWPTYEIMVLPVIAIVISGWIAGRLRSTGAGRNAVLLAITSIIILACLSMPFEEFVVDTSGGLSPIREIIKVCRFIKLNAPQPVKILTLDAGIAYQGNFDLLPGLEMSEFSFFPAWSEEKCRANKVVNSDILIEAIEKGVPDIIALRNRDIYMIGGQKPKELVDLIQNKYRWLATAVQYGQFYEPLRIYKRRDGEPSLEEAALEPEAFPEIPDQLLPW